MTETLADMRKRTDVLLKARALMNHHGLKNWGLELDGGKRRIGACHHSKRKITLSRHFIALNDLDTMINTVLHEIAHALAGYEAGHGPEWKMWAKAVGAKPERCANNVEAPEGRWLAVCPGCGHRHTRVRWSKNLVSGRLCCGFCRSPLTWVDTMGGTA